MRIQYTDYQHYGTVVTVRKDLKGKHREHCLCHSCVLFHPGDFEKNCKIAQLLYTICMIHNIVTPVWECPRFVERPQL